MSYYGNLKIHDIISQRMNEFCNSLVGNIMYLNGKKFICSSAEYIPNTRCFSITDESGQSNFVFENDSFAVETSEKDVFFQ